MRPHFQKSSFKQGVSTPKMRLVPTNKAYTPSLPAPTPAKKLRRLWGTFTEILGF